MGELNQKALYEKAGQLGSTEHLHAAARIAANEITGAEVVYTLPVVDMDGHVTGKSGCVLVRSREIVLRICALEDLGVGEAAQTDAIPAGHRWWVLPDGRRFDEVQVTDKPNPYGQLQMSEANLLHVWLRVE